MKNKRGLAPIVFILALLLVGSGVYFGVAGTGSITGNSDDIYVYDSGRLECLEDQAQQSVIKYADQNYEFECGKDYLVDECRVYVSCADGGFTASNCKGDYLLNGNKVFYDLRKGETKKLITTAKAGDKIKFYGATFNYGEDGTKVEYEFNAYRLATFERGAKFISSSSSCCLAEQSELSKQNFEYGDWKCLDKSGSNQFLNYFLNWEKISGAKVYGNQICQGNALYELEFEKLADGSTRKVQGNKVRDVECCPQQSAQCSSETFTFLKANEPEERTCSFDYQCENSGNPWTTSRVSAQKEVCQSGQCVPQTFNIECNSDDQCRAIKGDGWGCDLTYDNFGKCIEVGKIALPRCGDGICQTGETAQNCLEDCEIICPADTKLVRKESKENCWIPIVNKFGCDTKVETYCDDGGTNWLKVFFIIVGLIALLILLIRFFPVIAISIKKILPFT